MKYLQENVRERASEVGSINIRALFLRHVHIGASWAENLDMNNIIHKEVRKKIFSFKFGVTFTLEVLSSSDMPIGTTICLSQRTLGQLPNLPSRYFSLMRVSPLGERMNLAWISPYRSVASW